MKRLLLATALLLAVSPTTAHADVEQQGPLSVLVMGATASAPAVRLNPPETPPEIPYVDNRSVEQMIRDVWPDDLETRALKIAFRESRYVPTAHTWCCYGIFQLYLESHKALFNAMGIYTKQDLYDPLTNIKAAYALYLEAVRVFHNGWQPWQT